MPALITQTKVDGDSATSSFTIAQPADLQDGDVLYVSCSVFNLRTIAPPSGWTELEQEQATGASSITFGLFRKVITDASGEPANYTFSWTSNSRHAAVCLNVRGVDTADPEEVGTVSVITGTGDLTVPAVTAANDGTLLLGFCGARNSVPAVPPLDLLGVHFNRGAGGGNQALSVGMDRIDTGSSGTRVFQQGVNEAIGILIAVNPGPVVANDPYVWDARGTVDGSVAGSFAITMPELVEDGDLLVAVVAFDGTGSTITPPGGWSTVAEDGNTDVQGGIYIKEAASEPASYNWAISPGSSGCAASVYALRNVATTVDVLGTRTAATNQTITALGITPSAKSIVILAAIADNKERTAEASDGLFVGNAVIVALSNDQNPFIGFLANAGAASGNQTILTTSSSAYQSWLVSFLFQAAGNDVAVGQVVEVETANPITPLISREVAVGQASESEVANPIDPETSRNIPVGQATERELANPITPSIGRLVLIGQATEVETANGITPLITREVLVGQATEVELARVISPDKPIFVPVQTAVERELARIITPQVGEAFLPVVECEVFALGVECATIVLGVQCSVTDGYGQNH